MSAEMSAEISDRGLPHPQNKNAWHWHSLWAIAQRSADQNANFRGLYDAERGAHEHTRQRLRDAIAGLKSIAEGQLPDGDHPNVSTIMHAEAVLEIVMRP